MKVYAIIRRYYDIYGKRNKAVRVLGSRYSLETLLRRLKSLTGRTYITTKYYFVPFISFSSIVKSLNFHWNKFETPRLSLPLLFCSPIFNSSPKLHSMVIQTLMPRRCDPRWHLTIEYKNFVKISHFTPHCFLWGSPPLHYFWRSNRAIHRA